MLGAEKAYAKLEQKLQRYLDTYEAAHNYDEYHFYLDEIEHDPYVLISILSALHDGVFTLAEVQGELEMLFEKQYILTETVTMQIRYRTKMMVVIGPYGVPQVITSTRWLTKTRTEIRTFANPVLPSASSFPKQSRPPARKRQRPAANNTKWRSDHEFQRRRRKFDLYVPHL